MIRVLLVDDHAVVREGLRAFLELQDGIEVVGEAGDGREGVAAAERLRPDVVLMDLVMPRLDGVGAMRELRERLPAVRVIVLTSFADDDNLLPAVQAGAAGYLLKNAEPHELARAIRAAHAGEALLDPHVAARLLASLARPAGEPTPDELTPREHQVLELIARGFSNKRIARELGIAEKTVKTHVGHVLAKLGVADRTQAALHAVRGSVLGPIDPGICDLPRPSFGGMPTAIVTGASRGLGRALTAALLREGRRVVIDARGARELDDAVRELSALGDVVAVRGNVTDADHREALVDAAGPDIDALVNNASVLGPSPQPALADYPVARARARVPRQRARAARARPARAPAPHARRRDPQRHLRRRRRALRGLGRLRVLQGGARAADRHPRRRARRPPDLRRRPRRHAHADAPGRVPRRGHLRPAAAGGERARPARADRRRAAERALPRRRSRGARVNALAFELPSCLEATAPPESRGVARDEVRLMVASREDDTVEHARFGDLPDHLRAGDLLVVNVSATLPAAVPARHRGKAVELRFATAAPDLDRGSWWIVELRSADGASPLGAGRAGETVELPGDAAVELVAPYAGGTRLWLARVSGTGTLHDYLALHGHPIRYGYVQREWPLDAYQTVFATEPGSAEMPSAGRPFTPELVARLVSQRRADRAARAAHRRLLSGARRGALPRALRASPRKPRGWWTPSAGGAAA